MNESVNKVICLSYNIFFYLELPNRLLDTIRKNKHFMNDHGARVVCGVWCVVFGGGGNNWWRQSVVYTNRMDG